MDIFLMYHYMYTSVSPKTSIFLSGETRGIRIKNQEYSKDTCNLHYLMNWRCLPMQSDKRKEGT